MLVNHVPVSAVLCGHGSKPSDFYPADQCFESHIVPGILGEEIVHNLKNMVTVYLKILTAMCSL